MRLLLLAALLGLLGAEARPKQRRARERAPQDCYALFMRGIELHRGGDLPAAIAEFRRSLECDETASAHYGLGTVLADAYDLVEAEAHLRAAVALDPSLMGAYESLGLLYFNQARLYEAADQWDAAMRLGSQTLFNNYGVLLRDLGRHEQAEMAYREGIRVSPSDTNNYWNLFQLQRDMGNAEGALATVESIAAQAAQTPGFKMTQAALHQLLGHTGKTANLLREGRKLAAAQGMAPHSVGSAYVAANACPVMDSELNNKISLHRNFRRLEQLLGPEAVAFYPRSYALPGDMDELLRASADAGPGALWITKPAAMASGRGIRVVAPDELEGLGAREEDWLVQQYVADPFLVDGLKFDVRMYVVITGTQPARLYMYPGGYTRFASHAYDVDAAGYGNSKIHVTNDGVNRHFKGEGQPSCGANRNARVMLADAAAQGHDVDAFWEAVRELSRVTFAGTYLAGAHAKQDRFGRETPSHCYTLYGMDVLLDEAFSPHLLEVNTAPGMLPHCAEDHATKDEVCDDVVALAAKGNRARSGAARGRARKRAPEVLDWLAQQAPELRALAEAEGLDRVVDELLDARVEFENRGAFELIFPSRDWRRDLRLLPKELHGLHELSAAWLWPEAEAEAEAEL